MIQASALKLLAEDADDLKVIAAALQDAVGKIGDISYEPRAHRLTLAFNRYRWEGGGGERVRAAVQVGSVLKVQARKLRRNARDAVVELLSIEFEPGEAPAGALTFTFAGGGDLRAQVECLDVVLADVSAPWATPRVPRHEA
jgi:hypothetical protein